MRMRNLVLDLSVARIFPEKINKFFLPKKLGIIDVLSTVPRIDAIPRQSTSIPKDDVNESNPNKSTNTMEVNEMKADTDRPKNKATIKKEVKSVQKGKANKQIPLEIRDKFVTTNEETHGKSTIAPITTRPRVLETPIREMIKAADSLLIPF